MIALGLGSSDRDALGWLRRAVAGLKELPGLRILKVSPIYQSDALLPSNAPASWDVPYLNLAVSCELVETRSNPLSFLAQLKALETHLGRQERERWAPREIDIDLLAWEGVVLHSEKLSLPHLGLLERPFALLPLADVAPRLLAALPPHALELVKQWNAPATQVPFRTHRRLDRLTELVAILNLTPDSFSDGGKLSDSTSILASAQNAIEHGASILDLGAESTRPGATPVDPNEEWRRLEPALRALAPLRAATPGLRLSLDSRHPATVEKALELGCIDWINDVTGFASEAMRAVAKNSKASLVVMHSLGVPAKRDQTWPPDADPIQLLLDWGRARLDELERVGIARQRVILDPGVGFGKTPSQSLAILRNVWQLHAWGARVLVGHSRKSFLAAIKSEKLQVASHERDLETALITGWLADQGSEYLRVHDVATQARALRLSAAWGGVSVFSGSDRNGAPI